MEATPAPPSAGVTTLVTHPRDGPNRENDHEHSSGRPAAPDVFELGPSTSRSSSATTPAPASRPSSRSTPPPSARPSAAPASTPTPPTADALSDVLNLSRGMTYKAALAGLDLGGGKAVIIGDPTTAKTEALLRAYGRFVQSLGGRYYTACDVGTYSADMDVVARECALRHRPHHRARRRRRLVGADGVRRLPGHARRGRGRLGLAVARRPDRRRLRRRARSVTTWSGSWSRTAPRSSSPTSPRRRSTGWSASTPTSGWPGRPTQLVASALDVYAPCALGGALDRRRGRGAVGQDRLRRRQQPARPPGRREGARGARHPLRPRLLRELRRPDPGGRRARGLLLRARQGARGRHLRHHPRGVRARRRPTGVPPAIAADRLAERRMRDVGRLRGVWLPND